MFFNLKHGYKFNAMTTLARDIATALKQAGNLPISMKAVVLCNSHALLLRQPDGIWELPGGRLEHGEDALSCLVREVKEESGLSVTVEHVLNTWIREKNDGSLNFVITALAYAWKKPDLPRIRISKEHIAARFVRLGDQPPAPILDGYVKGLRLAGAYHRNRCLS